MREIYKCRCESCQGKRDAKTQKEHHQINLLMSRMDEQQRRWYGAVEAQRLGYGGMTEVSRITGLHVETIRIGIRELAEDLAGRPTESVRIKGGGRKKEQKKA